jgi:hypothetical protein
LPGIFLIQLTSTIYFILYQKQREILGQYKHNSSGIVRVIIILNMTPPSSNHLIRWMMKLIVLWLG